MEGRRNSTGADMPPPPLFNHPPSADSYMEELLQGLVNSNRPIVGDGQGGFRPWTTYGDEANFNQPNFMGWNAFRPTLDLTSAARSSSSSSHVNDLPTGSSNFNSGEDYLNSLSPPESDNSSGAGGAGLFYPSSDSCRGNLLGDQSAAVKSGHSLYSEALNHWMNFTDKSYEPFGRPDIFQLPTDNDKPLSEPVSPNEASSGSMNTPLCCNSAKLSYSDVARNQPIGSPHQQGIGKSKTGGSTPPCEFPEFPGFSVHGASQNSTSSHGRRHKIGPSSRLTAMRPSSPQSTEKPPIIPGTKNSLRLGHDQFGDAMKGRERYKQQLNCEDGSSPQSRKGSTSSVGSGSSGLEEIYCTRTQSTCSSLNQEDIRTLGCDTSSFDRTSTTSISASAKHPKFSGSRSPVVGDPPIITQNVKARTNILHKTSRPHAASSPLPVPSACGLSEKCAMSPSCPSSLIKPDGEVKKNQAFFDPKRIFDQKVLKGPSDQACSSEMPSVEHRETATAGAINPPSVTPPVSEPKPVGLASDNQIPNNQNQGPTHKEKGAGNLLNNGKAKSNLYPTNNVHHPKPATTHYINNDLRQPTKETNTEGRNSPNRSTTKSTNTPPTSEELPFDHPQNETADAQSPAAPAPAARRKQDYGAGKKAWSEPRPSRAKRSRRHREPSASPSYQLFMYTWTWCEWLGVELMQHAQSVFILVIKVTLALLAVGFSGIVTGLGQLWQWLRTNIPYLRPQVRPEEDESFDWSNPSSQSRFRTVGLDKNITLPTTGEEAMKRLLACKGKDPYSILGVRVDSPDEEIKKYYRKQAVLVHPDKNNIPGAEEAFKILGHSFDIIGEPGKRSLYDAQRHETQETETAMHEFADLLAKLRTKMQEAVNLMRCEKCWGQHRRVPVERPWYNARFCDKCNVRHAAKEGDVWAESRVIGFLWHYYACMEGKIYDITEWASCQSGNFKHIQANAHLVIYRISTQAGSRQRSQNSTGRGSNEPVLNDFINQFFHRPNPDSPQSQYSSASATSAANSAAAAAVATAVKKRGRKKKKY